MKPDEPGDFLAYRERLLVEQLAAGVSHPWPVPASLAQKVALDGRLLPLEGDTIVFRLAPEELDWLDALRSRLVDGLGELFCEPLLKEELHLTLHDLSVPSSDVNLERSRSILGGLSQARAQIEAISLFNCLNISVLVGFAPVSADDYARLLGWHRAFDQVVELGHWFRPHVTLAYFRPRSYTAPEVERLRARLSSLEPSGRLVLDPSRLFYQRFTDMNHFRDLVGFSG